MKRYASLILTYLLVITLSLGTVFSVAPAVSAAASSKITISNVPAYSDSAWVEINNNTPYFTESEITTKVFETYSDLDGLGRCGVAYANICKDIMPAEERGTIGMIKPSGWQTVKYDFVDGKYLYNRCHLIGYQLAGENANVKNLITGTRYLNIVGMLDFENTVSGYLEEKPNNHVLYRVTPIFKGDNLVASGVEMEGYSVEDKGKGVCFNVYCYNVQPGVTINYADGTSCETKSDNIRTVPRVNTPSTTNNSNAQTVDNKKSYTYVLNTNTHKFHRPDCGSVSDMKEKNKKYSSDDRETIINNGYSPCKRCNP